MNEKYEILECNFTKPAIYKIVVQGKLDYKWSDRMLGLLVNIEKGEGQKPISTLIGKIKDQAALSVILNRLYEILIKNENKDYTIKIKFEIQHHENSSINVPYSDYTKQNDHIFQLCGVLGQT